MSEQAKFQAWWDECGFNSVILRAAAWEAWMARAELKDPTPPANQPDPDEWVVQDLVPPRAGVDQWKWVAHDERDDDILWEIGDGKFTVYKHGQESCGETLQVRCRRRDLPPAEKTEKTTTIEVNPGDGYRWLEDHEIVQPDDEVFNPAVTPCWVKPLTRAGSTVKAFSDDDYPVRRKAMALLKPEPDHIADDRKKVPQTPAPQPAKTRVRLWISGVDGSVYFGESSRLRTDCEIYHDADGFYVEGTK